jgi:hypothetical protein
MFRVCANDGADRGAVLAQASGTPPAAVAAIGQAFLRRRADRVGLEGAVFLNSLVDGRGGERGSHDTDAVWLCALIIDLRRLNARDEEVVGERGRRGVGGGSGCHGGRWVMGYPKRSMAVEERRS